MKRYVVGFLFPLDAPGSVVLLKKATAGKPEVYWQNGLLNGVGGKVEPGEDLHEAMDRECLEEVGGLIATWEHVATLSDGLFELGVFRAECALDEVPEKNDVGEEFYEVTIREVVSQKQKTIPNLQWLVPMAVGADSAFWPLQITQQVLP